MAREYQGLVVLAHHRVFLRVAYVALRAGRMLCSGDIAFALAGIGESTHKVRALCEEGHMVLLTLFFPPSYNADQSSGWVSCGGGSTTELPVAVGVLSWVDGGNTDNITPLSPSSSPGPHSRYGYIQISVLLREA